MKAYVGDSKSSESYLNTCYINCHRNNWKAIHLDMDFYQKTLNLQDIRRTQHCFYWP